MTILSVTVTEAGRTLARRLPWETAHGAIGTVIRDRWDGIDGLVVFAATGVATRIVAPLLGTKDSDPAVVCVDEAGQWAVALVGGHHGANALARQVAALLGAQAVITTATDASDLAALDTIPGYAAAGDVAGVTAALLDGAPVWVANPSGWPLPASLSSRLDDRQPDAGPGVVVTDEQPPPGRVVTLHPASLVVGVGASAGAPVDVLAALADGALATEGLDARAVAAVATLDRKTDEPAIAALAAARWGVPLIGLPAADLRAVVVPNPSQVVADAVGTPSVAEAAALAVAGPGATLVIEKHTSPTSTVAVARRLPPVGHLAVVGVGPGHARHRTPAATAAVRHAEVVIGYGPYIELVADAIAPGANVLASPIGEERTRAKQALVETEAGRRVALVCSGDAGVFALASLVFEIAAAHPSVDAARQIEVVPGVTAALASAAVLGAPLGHDHVAISLSDLLTPWETIVRRVEAAAVSDLVVSFYNPRSAGRDWQLAAAVAILAAHRPPSTPVGVVTDAGRPGQRVVQTTIAEFDPTVVTMTSCVIVGASTTTTVGGRMITPRGYQR